MAYRVWLMADGNYLKTEEPTAENQLQNHWRNGLGLRPVESCKLKGDRTGQKSIRINDQWRVCFYWTDAGAENVEIVDYH